MKDWKRIQVINHHTRGDLFLPVHPKGVVVFVHGSGSDRHSIRNNFIAQTLVQEGFAALLFDLTTTEESIIGLFDLEKFAHRVSSWVIKIQQHEEIAGIPVFLFGGSTGAAIAIRASIAHPNLFQGIVSRGGRIDLVSHLIPQFACPILLIVGGEDTEVLKLNQEAFTDMRCQKKINIIAGAGHLFHEHGSMDEVAKVTKDWLNSLIPSKRPKLKTNSHA